MKQPKRDKQRMKIVLVTPRLAIGGAERLLIDIAKKLNRERYEVYWCALEPTNEIVSSWEQEITAAGIPFRVLASDKRSPYKIGRLWRLVKIGFRFWRYLREIRPDIMQTQLFADLYRPIGRLARVPIIIGVEHNLDYDEPHLFQIIKKLCHASADGVIAVSEAVRQDVIKRYSYTPNKVIVIYDGIDETKFYRPLSVSKMHDARSPWRIGGAGRLVPQKGFDILIKALAKLPAEIKWRCQIAGAGPLQAELASLIKNLNLEHKVSLIGVHSDLRSFFSRLDIFVIPSCWEGLGLVALEAGAAGVPVIASATGGLQEIIQHRYSGFLVDNLQPETLAQALEYIFIGDGAQELSIWAKNWQKEVMSRFTITQTACHYEEYYERIIHEKS